MKYLLLVHGDEQDVEIRPVIEIAGRPATPAIRTKTDLLPLIRIALSLVSDQGIVASVWRRRKLLRLASIGARATFFDQKLGP